MARSCCEKDRFAAAVEAIYDAAAAPDLWPAALQAIADCFDDVGAILLYRRDDGTFGAIETPTLQVAMDEYRRDYSHRDIRAQRSMERGYFLDRDAVTDRDVVSAEEMQSHPVYTELAAKYGLKYFAGVSVSPDPHVAVAISIQRRADKEPYSDSELEILTRLGRHAEKALRLSIQLFDAELVKVGLGEALTRLGIGVFALDSLERVVFSNPAALRLLGDGLEIANERLRIAPGADRTKIEAAIGQVLRGEGQRASVDPKPMMVERSQGGRPLAVYVLPIAMTAASRDQLLTHARAIVLIIDPGQNGPHDPAVVRDALGLTLAEARVASLVGSGLPPRAAAEQLGITEETARTTLKRVFGKVGVSRQSELTALLTRMVLR